MFWGFCVIILSTFVSAFFQFQTCILIYNAELSISCLSFSDELNISIHNSETTTTSCKVMKHKTTPGSKKAHHYNGVEKYLQYEREKQKVQGSKGTWPSYATRSKLPLMFVKLICKLFVSQVQFRLYFLCCYKLVLYWCTSHSTSRVSNYKQHFLCIVIVVFVFCLPLTVA